MEPEKQKPTDRAGGGLGIELRRRISRSPAGDGPTTTIDDNNGDLLRAACE
jgi:hypothetical protein